MIVKELLDEAPNRLVTIGADALLIEAANALANLHAELVIVCDSSGKAIGVITRTDVVSRISHCEGAACRMSAAAAMTRELVSCRPDDPISEVWDKMKQRRLRRIPILDDRSHPVGVINARDALQVLLMSAANETELLREYVMSVGYR